MIFSRRDIAPPVREQEIIVAVGNCEMEMVTSRVALYNGVPDLEFMVRNFLDNRDRSLLYVASITVLLDE